MTDSEITIGLLVQSKSDQIASHLYTYGHCLIVLNAPQHATPDVIIRHPTSYEFHDIPRDPNRGHPSPADVTQSVGSDYTVSGPSINSGPREFIAFEIKYADPDRSSDRVVRETPAHVEEALTWEQWTESEVIVGVAYDGSRWMLKDRNGPKQVDYPKPDEEDEYDRKQRLKDEEYERKEAEKDAQAMRGLGLIAAAFCSSAGMPPEQVIERAVALTKYITEGK